MTDDHMALLRELAGDLPPLPDEVWNCALDAAFDPDAAADSDLVPEMDDHPVVPEDEDIVLDDIVLEDEDIVLDDALQPADDSDSDSDLSLADDLAIDPVGTEPGDDGIHHLDIDLERVDEPGEDLL
ncbi:hypothetical protein [Rhodococcus sovatensis]|uniref:Uncharacterized protein n=1 Tax=Rhodococcus sovatensis TaxID=1805840 RepID=A0ABZ2PJ48_9NOCA